MHLPTWRISLIATELDAIFDLESKAFPS